MKAKGLGIEVIEEGKRIGTLTSKQFRDWMNRPNAFIPALVKDFNSQDRGVTVQQYIIK